MWFNQSYSNLIISNNDDVSFFYEFIDKNLLHISLLSQLNESQEITLNLRYNLIPILESFKPEKNKNSVSHTFWFYQTFTYTTDCFTLNVGLPKWCLERNPPSPPYDEKDDSGHRTHYTWEFLERQALSYLNFGISFNEPLPASNPIWGYIIGPILGMIVGASIVYLLMKRGSSRLEEELEKIYLTKNQQLLLKIIEEKQGKTTQQEIIAITNFSKSKVSRNLTPLEENGLVVKEKWGREYKVSITKKGMKVAEKIVAKKLQNSEIINQPDISKEEKTTYR